MLPQEQDYIILKNGKRVPHIGANKNKDPTTR
jgi:hypothetical protein